MTAVRLGWRVAPLGRAHRMVARNALVARHIWYLPVSGLFEPVFYLLSIGIGIGKLVGGIRGPNGHIYPYATYVAPALLAASAMNGSIYECTFNVYFKLKFAKVYDAILATPMRAVDVARGEIITALLRSTLYSTVFVVMMAGLGDVASGWAALAMPAALLIGFAFASVAMAATTYMRGWTDFDLVNLIMLPLFLFSTTFYPLATYPRWLQIVVECTPLYHGVVLERSLTLGIIGPALIGHIAYLAAMGVVGLTVAGRRVRVLLLS
ncbi:MAG TPA: ABC transporter permease [Acidimicrobiales bacterium]|jgi:lipooligosaccharide transport system permease protein|nr:ABC transporter permease [Acidimicrobiales bacterium]